MTNGVRLIERGSQEYTLSNNSKSHLSGESCPPQSMNLVVSSTTADSSPTLATSHRGHYIELQKAPVAPQHFHGTCRYWGTLYTPDRKATLDIDSRHTGKRMEESKLYPDD